MNKYLKGYYNLIDYASSQNRKRGEKYYENHHIIPKSFGGNNFKDNMVLLTAKEHYIAHYLLTKFTKGNLLKKAVWAFDMMNNNANNQKRKINSTLYEKNKILTSKHHHMKDLIFVTKKYKGANNGMSKIWQIFDTNGNLIYTTIGSFMDFCNKNKLPYKAFYRSSLHNGEKIYMSQPWQTPIKYKKYTGWYCVKQNK